MRQLIERPGPPGEPDRTADDPTGQLIVERNGAVRNESLVVIPTYNELDNLKSAVSSAVSAGHDVLVIDDNSPDGTGDMADEMARSMPGVRVMHRDRKLGLGSAYRAGFTIGLNQGYRFLLEMDADGSHQPHDLPALLAAASKSNGLAIGSRYIRGGSTVGWSVQRRVLSKAANIYCSVLLRKGLTDWTSGYRCYSADALKSVGIHRVLSDGFAFQIELAYLCLLEGIPVVEIPIEFKDRQIGYSKASNAEIWQALACVSRLRRCYLLPHSTPGDNSANTAVQQVSWQDPHDAQNQDSAEHPLAAAVVGVLAHNEEATIEASLRAILAEDDGQTRAARVVVITSGCTDRTEEIVRGVASRDPRVRLIVEARRNGKVAAINLLLRETTEPLVVVLGGDMVFAPGSLLKLLAPFRDEKVGMTGARPIPTNPRRGIVGNAVNILWDLHHELSLRHPKLGEAVAFRRTVDGFGQDTIFDEATMEYLVQSKGLRLKYVPEAIVRNRGPETMRDYVAHRTRNHRGHLALASVTGYRVATMNGPALARAAWKLWRRGEHAHNIALAIAIEVFTRTRARWSRAVGQRETPIWQAIPSTKRVVAYGHVLRAHHDSFETIQFVQAASTKRATKRMPRQAIRKMLRSEDRLRVGSNNVRITVRSDITGALALRSRLQAELANYSYVPSDQARLTAEDCHNPA